MSVRATSDGSETRRNEEAVTHGNTEEKITELVGDQKRAVEVEKQTGELCEATNHTRDSIYPEEQAIWSKLMASVRLMRLQGFIFVLNCHFNDVIWWPFSAIWPADKPLAANEVFWPHFSRSKWWQTAHSFFFKSLCQVVTNLENNILAQDLKHSHLKRIPMK